MVQTDDKCKARNCSGRMVLRESNGSKFFGCSNFPDCRMVYNIEKELWLDGNVKNMLTRRQQELLEFVSDLKEIFDDMFISREEMVERMLAMAQKAKETSDKEYRGNVCDDCYQGLKGEPFKDDPRVCLECAHASPAAIEGGKDEYCTDYECITGEVDNFKPKNKPVKETPKEKPNRQYTRTPIIIRIGDMLHSQITEKNAKRLIREGVLIGGVTKGRVVYVTEPSYNDYIENRWRRL